MKTFLFRIVQSFEIITFNLALSSDNFSLSEEEVSVKSERVRNYEMGVGSCTVYQLKTFLTSV